MQWQVFNGGVWTNLSDNATYVGTGTNQLTILNAPVTFNGNQYRLGLIAVCTTTYSNGAALTVHANPVVSFTAINPVAACGGVPVVLNGNPTGGSGTYTQHTWTGDVGPLSNFSVQSPTFSTLIPGPYHLTYKVKDSNTCTASDTLTVNVDAPDATFSEDVTTGCTPVYREVYQEYERDLKFWWNL